MNVELKLHSKIPKNRKQIWLSFILTKAIFGLEIERHLEHKRHVELALCIDISSFHFRKGGVWRKKNVSKL